MSGKDNAKDRDTQWHSGFYSAMLLRCRNYLDRIDILREFGIEVTETSPGVDNVDAPPPMFKTTIAAYGRMPPEDAAWLSALTSKIKEPQALELAHQMHTMWDDADKAMQAALESVFYVSFEENRELFSRIRSEHTMVKWFNDMMEEGEQRGEARGRQKGMLDTLFSLVRKGRLTAAEASAEADMALPLFQTKMAEYEARPQA